MGAQLVKEVATKTNDAAGDGTTTATLLAQALIREGMKNIAAGANPMIVRKGISKAVDAAVSAIIANSKVVEGTDDIARVATISSADENVGKLIAEAMEKVTSDGVITIEESKTAETYSEVVEGMQFDRGYISPYMATDSDKMTAVIDDAYILITDKKISSVQEILPLLEQIVQAGKKLVIIAEDIEGEALTTLILNKLRGTFVCVGVKAPGFGDRRKEMLKDIAILTGGEVITEELGLELKETTMEQLGRARQVVIGKENTIIVDGAGSSEDVKERIGRILLMHANHREEIPEIYAGEIGAVIGLKSTTTGETLCGEGVNVTLESMEFPEPVIEEAIEPKTKADQEKMSLALSKLAEEDPTFKVHTSEESGQTIIAGVGELHLDIIVDRLKREFGVQVNVGKPQVGYRETIRTAGDCEGKYIKQSGGRGQYGHVVIKFEPNEGKGFEFVNAIVGGTVPKEYIKPTQDGLVDALQRGLVAGYPVIDIKATLHDGSYHDVDSSEAAYKIAASMALKEAAKKCNPVILEPIMKVEVTVPEQYYGDVIGDISRRRGQMTGESQRGNAKIVEAEVPLAEMFGYVTDLRSFTQGRGSYSMEFDHFGECPKFIQEEIIKKSGTKN